MEQRGLLVGDVLHLLKFGSVYEAPEDAETIGYYKYQIEGKTPNSGGRSVRAVVIPHLHKDELKIITVMWVDER